MPSLNTKRYIRIIAVVALLIFLHFTKILFPIESFITKTLSPVFSKLYSASSYLRTTYNEQTDKRDLIELVSGLEGRNNDLIVENAKLKVALEENQILREYLKFSKENDKSFVLGSIISRIGLDANELDKNIIINKGSRDGIMEGLAVISGRGILVGRVVEVKDKLSEICLVANRDCKMAATIQNSDKTSGIVSGELGLTIKMEFIPQTEQVEENDIVITSGLEENMPNGLVIGRVTFVNKESNELWQTATIEPLADLDDLTIVSVLMP